jgi:hypothetical protein
VKELHRNNREALVCCYNALVSSGVGGFIDTWNGWSSIYYAVTPLDNPSDPSIADFSIPLVDTIDKLINKCDKTP